MPKREINIKLILQGCLRDNRDSQRKLYEHFYGYAMNISLRYSRNREEALEVLNDAFLKVFNNLNKYDQDYPFKGWLRRILINAAIDYHRVHHKHHMYVALDETQELADTPLPLPEIGTTTDVLPILQKLTPAYRMVFNLYVMEGYKHNEIAEMLGISSSASRSNLVRAKEKLRELLTRQNSSLANTK